MADLVVLGFPSKEKAEAVLTLAGQLVKEELLDLEDAALVWRTTDGKIRTQQSFSPAGAAAASGALWGTLFGTLFLMPVFGMAVGAASGAVAGKLTDIGINDKFMKDVAAALEPGSAAVFALVRRSTPDRVREALKPYQPTVIHTSLRRTRKTSSFTRWPAEGYHPERAAVWSSCIRVIHARPNAPVSQADVSETRAGTVLNDLHMRAAGRNLSRSAIRQGAVDALSAVVCPAGKLPVSVALQLNPLYGLALAHAARSLFTDLQGGRQRTSNGAS